MTATINKKSAVPSSVKALLAGSCYLISLAHIHARNSAPKPPDSSPSSPTTQLILVGQQPSDSAYTCDKPGSHTRYLLINTLLSGNHKLLETMLAEGMDINRQDHQLGYSVIHELVFIKNIPALELCLKLGADPDRKAPKTGTFALYDSISKDNIELSRTLLKGDADPNQFENRFANTALHAAIMDNLTTHAKLLLRCGADPDRSNRLGLTPLLLSVSVGTDLITTLLLENGANPDKPSSKGVYPLDVAKIRKREEAGRMLRQYGAVKSKSEPKGFPTENRNRH